MDRGKSCPVCHEDSLSIFWEALDLPVHCNLLWPSREAALHAPKGDISLGLCGSCGMIYNVAFDPNLMEYAETYETSLHFSPHFQEYAEWLASRLLERFHLNDKTIIEIGCGKGEFLSLLCKEGRNRGIGFDPSFDGNREGLETTNHITFIRDFYSEKYATTDPADLVCCRQVLEHLDSPHDFLENIKRTIGGRGDTTVFFEVPNGLYTFRDMGIWDIIYEHCSYFAACSLARVFTENHFHILELYETFGGQFLCVEATPIDRPVSSQNDQSEEAKTVADLAFKFAEKYREKVEHWEQYLRRMAQQGKRMVVWGAGSKGVTFLNTLKGADHIECVVDLNPHKHGKFVAGRGQHIVPPSFLDDYQPHIIIVMNPNYLDEIRHMVGHLKDIPEIVVA